MKANTPRVQPKYSPDVQLEDMLAARVPDVSAKVAPGPYVDEYAYESWGDGTLDDEIIAEGHSDVAYQSAPSDIFSGTNHEPWEVIGAASDSKVYQGRVQEEREVFEL